VANVKYLGTTVTDQNSIHEEIKSRINLGNNCYHVIQDLLSSRLVPTSVKIKMYKTIILPVVFCRCETWPLTLRELHDFRVFQNRVLRNVFGRKMNKMVGRRRKFLNENLHNLYFLSNVIRISKSRRMG
jgi:hypothetical protein